MFESYPKGFPDFAPNTPGSWAVKQHFSRLADADIDIIFTQNYDNYLMQCKFTTIGKCHSPQNNWFQFLTHCIPKRISEPWLGDMCEMREAMRAEGYSERAVLWATVSQFALLLLHWGLSKGVDILTPFKKPKIE
jgi:hypothetical protein